MNPFKHRRGFWNRVSALLYPISGQAQVGIGIGKKEAPYVPPTNPQCPICLKPMLQHALNRGDAITPTYVKCPA